MHPTTLYQLACAQTTNLHQRAAQERTAKAARHAQSHHHAHGVPGHAVTAVARVLALAGGHGLSPTR